MAFKFVKEANDKQALVIYGWEGGISQSAETGLANSIQTSHEMGGEISSGWPFAVQTVVGATLGKPTYGCVDYSVPAGTGNGTYTYYMLDASGQAFGSSGDGTWHSLGNTTTGATALNQGIGVWHNYILVFRNASIDYAPTNNPTSWTSGWKSITGSTYHAAINAQDDGVYFCNGNAVGSLLVAAGQTFDPTNAATYTFNASALALPFDTQSTCLAELGTNLMIGSLGNRIFPWNRTATTFTFPLFLPETFVWKMVNANNFLYIFMGNQLSRGRIYVTSGSAVSEFFKMPDSLANSVEPYWRWGDAIWHRNHLIFGSQPYQNSGNTVLTGVLGSGSSVIWAIKLGVSLLGATEQRLLAINGTLNGTQRATVLLPDIANSPVGGWDYFAGLDDAGGSPTYNIAASKSTAGTTDTAIVLTEIIAVGTAIQPKNFGQIEWKTSVPLTTGESVKLELRSNLNGSFTQVGVTNFTSGLTTISDIYVFNQQQFQWIQIRATLTGKTDGSHVRLTEIRLR